MKSLSAGRRKKIEARSAALIAEEMTLHEFRRARKLTQVRLAKALGISQDGDIPSRKAKRSSAFDPEKECRGHGRQSVPRR